jgi:hypothetical protein
MEPNLRSVDIDSIFPLANMNCQMCFRPVPYLNAIHINLSQILDQSPEIIVYSDDNNIEKKL